MKNLTGLTLGDEIDNFGAETSSGPITFHSFFGNQWGLLCSHPDDFTPICTTELAEMARLEELGEFKKRDVKIIGLSCNDVESHREWIKDVEALGRSVVNFPIIADKSRTISQSLGMLSSDDLDLTGMPLTVRSVFIIDPLKKIRLMLTYPASTGRNFVEILRVIDSLQMTDRYAVATPVNWQTGERVVIVPTMSEDEVTKQFSEGFETQELPSGKGYLRWTADPTTTPDTKKEEETKAPIESKDPVMAETETPIEVTTSEP